MKEDIIGVTFIKTDLGIQTILCAYPNAECRQEHMDEGYKIIYEKELYELPLLDRCAREGYRMTKEEEKQVEKEVKEYFSIEKYQQIKCIIEELGIDAYYRNPPKGLTPEEQKKFEQMYLLYRKTSDLDAFGYAIGNSFILTKPFMYGGLLDNIVGYPETKEIEYLQMAVEQNPNSSLAGTIVGGGVSYAVGSAVVSKIPGVGKVLGNAGQALSKLPLLNKLGAEGITRVLADTMLDTAIDTVPTMVEMAYEGESAESILKEGVKKTGVNIALNGAFETGYQVADNIWDGVVKSGINGGSRTINPNEIRYSQSSVNGSNDIIQSMREKGWIGDPIDVVEMPDGIYTTIDNTRVASAREAGIDVQANVHGYNDPLPSEYIERFTTKKGIPKTWGEAIELRVGKQKASFRNGNPYGQFEMETMK